MSRMAVPLTLALAAVFLAIVPGWAGSSLDIKFEKYELPNGLEVILHEDHSIPTVAVNIWYHVGSKNEKPGRTGFAHVFEHMMFQGSQHVDQEYFVPLQRIGATINGSTSEDRTNYWENVPANYLELALFMEADRMGYLLPTMTQEKLDTQKDVVKNERREVFENQPYGKADELYLPLLYPGDHPYSWSVIGSMADLSAASLEDVSDFFRHYYTPNNASLCIAGDFRPEEAKQLVEKYFAPLPPGPAVDRMTAWIPRLEGVRREVAEDNVSLPRLYSVWHTPAFYAPGDAEFDILTNLLTSGKTSRLYRSLVYEREIAQDVSVYQDSRELGSIFIIQITAKKGHTLAEVEAAMDAELARLLKDGITRTELQQAQNVMETDFTRALERTGGFGGKADRLNRYNVMLGDPGRFEWDLNRYRRSTVESVNKYAREFLALDRRAILYIVPRGDLAAAGPAPDLSALPGPAGEPTFTPPSIQRTTLPNGLELRLVEKKDLPLIQASLVVNSGWAADPANRFGAAALTAELLDEGTKTRNALEISEEVKSLGARLNAVSNFDGSFVSLNILKKNLRGGLDLMADVVLHPTFPEQELERQRAIYLGRIAQEAKDPTTSAIKTFLRELCGADHPYGQPFTGSGTEKTITSITRQDVVRYYEANYRPNNATLILVGDLSLKEAESYASAAFKEWRPAPGTEVSGAPLRPLDKTRILIVDKPGAAQSCVVVGAIALKRADPKYVALEIMDNAFAGKFTSRVMLNLREDKGFTYGVRSFNIGLREAGMYAIMAPVETRSTRETITELVKEIRDVVGPRPLTNEELTSSKDNLTKRFPLTFQTVTGIAGGLYDIVLYGLPDSEWQTYMNRVQTTDGDTATGAARTCLDPDALLIVVVGDREKIEQGIRELELGDVLLSSAE